MGYVPRKIVRYDKTFARQNKPSWHARVRTYGQTLEDQLDEF